jgi:hypothetical protein
MLGLIPSNTTITTEHAKNGVLTAVCVDADTERIMQRQRLIAMVGSPLVVYAGATMKAPLWVRLTVVAMGTACFMTHFSAYRTVYPHMKSKTLTKENDNE